MIWDSTGDENPKIFPLDPALLKNKTHMNLDLTLIWNEKKKYSYIM